MVATLVGRSSLLSLLNYYLLGLSFKSLSLSEDSSINMSMGKLLYLSKPAINSIFPVTPSRCFDARLKTNVWCLTANAYGSTMKHLLQASSTQLHTSRPRPLQAVTPRDAPGRSEELRCRRHGSEKPQALPLGGHLHPGYWIETHPNTPASMKT